MSPSAFVPAISLDVREQAAAARKAQEEAARKAQEEAARKAQEEAAAIQKKVQMC